MFAPQAFARDPDILLENKDIQVSKRGCKGLFHAGIRSSGIAFRGVVNCFTLLLEKRNRDSSPLSRRLRFVVELKLAWPRAALRNQTSLIRFLRTIAISQRLGATPGRLSIVNVSSRSRMATDFSTRRHQTLPVLRPSSRTFYRKTARTRRVQLCDPQRVDSPSPQPRRLPSPSPVSALRLKSTAPVFRVRGRPCRAPSTPCNTAKAAWEAIPMRSTWVATPSVCAPHSMRRILPSAQSSMQIRL
jgi:hypothetical protein